MTARLEPEFASAVLNDLEDLELPLLAWGVTTGELARDEVMDIINQRLAADSHGDQLTPQDVMQALLRQALLFQIPATSPPRYRTRLAEAVRLTSRLRQLFGPSDLTQPPNAWWEQGRPLVADYRLHVAPRRYPSRHIAVDAAMGEWQQLPGWGPLQSAVASAQIDGRSLARFQVDAARLIFESVSGSRGRGVIIGAGTGSGKTLAFYLPAFAAVAERARPGLHQLQVLALYPRKELLRDQLREAVESALPISTVLEKNGHRPLRFGALYADTPRNGDDASRRASQGAGRGWRQRGEDLICPYFPCPRCGRDLMWPAADRTIGREVLRCVSCRLDLGEHVALTRDSLRNRPPDVLFTTTEMLNRYASDARLGRLMGWQGAPAPSLVLLDEVHTYAGIHGAQVALLLRRWRNDLKVPVTFAGLSATLRDAAAFFAELTGLDETAVDHIEPSSTDLEPMGREYAIALRGDPVSGAGLLSTSIQAAMLYGRILDPRGDEYLHGSTGFIFTDDLDVTNRFYDDLRDAEGGPSRATRRRRTRRVLAALRSPDAPFARQRYNDGQSWDLINTIGHTLPAQADAGELVIGRTSSQDAGVDQAADLVVATASLEVGYNDPRVGLVLQHKAPHDPAAFIQRRGRAGRQRHMRPITVITLSDFGRDRLAYQAYDTLFAPDIPPRHLPIGNRFVLKIQGAQALLDWLAGRLTRETGSSRSRVDPRVLLRAPNTAPAAETDQTRSLAGLLERVLTDSSLQNDLAQHLCKALRISADEAQALLWEQPRALLLGVVPTALRRLNSNWRPVASDPGANPGDLLPEYLTRTLFDPLNVPEVWLDLPFGGGNSDEETLPIDKALREAVPGRVSRRYGHRRHDHRTWLPLPLPTAGGLLELDTIIVRGGREGRWEAPGYGRVEVIRPYMLRLQEPPPNISDRAQGVPKWASQIVEPVTGLYGADLPEPSLWSSRVISVGFATHAAGNPVEVRRMTVGAQCETTYQNAPPQSSTVRYAVGNAPAAMGFRITADAIRFEVAPLDLNDAAVAQYLVSPAWRTLAFTRAVADDPSLDGVANSFQRGWLTLVYLTAVALAGLDGTASAEQIHASVSNGAWRGDLPNVLQVLYRASSPSSQATPQLVATLSTLSQDAAVVTCLDTHGRLLWADDAARSRGDLAQRAYRDTLAAALLAAAQRACPDAQDRDLIVDVLPGHAAGEPTRIWLSETSIGGLGIVEQLVQYYSHDPRRFWGLVDSALGSSDHEYVDAALTRLLQHISAEPNGAASQAITDLRSAASAREADTALQRLRVAWSTLEGHPRHAAIAALSTRLLRPGTTRTTDLTALELVQAWDRLQQRLGFEVDARVVAYAVGSGVVPVPGASARPTADQVFSLLWPRGRQARVQHLENYQPYSQPALLDRLLIAAAHDERLPVIDVTDVDWATRYVSTVAAHGSVDLVAPADHFQALGDAVRLVPALAVDRDFLRVYGEVRKVWRAGSRVGARIDIREAVQ